MTKRFLSQPYTKFLFLGFLFLVAWFLLYYHQNSVSKKLDYLLIKSLVHQSAFILDVFYDNIENNHKMIWLEKQSKISVARNCNGLNLMFLFSAFIFAFPSKFITKVIYVLIGNLFIFYFNILRIFSLFVIFNYNKRWLEFNHKYTFTIFMYLVIFVMWMFFVKKYSNINQKK